MVEPSARAEALGSWRSRDYARAWAAEDRVETLLELPRRISTAIVADAGVDVRHVVDLGSGPGGYLEHFLRAFPEAQGTWTDGSEAMRELAAERLASLGDRVAYEIVDAEALAETSLAPADVVVSSRMLHHLPPESIARVYRAVHALLRPGGFFFNLDHVGVPDGWESVYRRVRERFTGPRRERLAPHRHDYRLASPEEHLAWARQAGFAALDMPWRAFFTVLVAARR